MPERIRFWKWQAEIYAYLTTGVFVNELDRPPADYDCRTIYDSDFGGSDGYICMKEEILEDISEFIRHSGMEMGEGRTIPVPMY